MNIWSELGIECREGLTQKDLKRAYAKKLKGTRPDRDPKGFQQLRKAYECAQLMLRDERYVEDDEEEFVSDTPPVSPPSDHTIPQLGGATAPVELPPLQRMMQAAHDHLREGKIGTALREAFPEIEHYLLSHPSEYRLWSSMLSELYATFPVLLDPVEGWARYIPSETLLVGELQSDQHYVISALTDYAVQRDDFELQKHLAQIIIDHQELLYSPRLVPLSSSLCLALAIPRVTMAKEIGEVAYKRASASSHDSLIVDDAIAFSQATFILERQPRKLWSDILNQRVSAKDIQENETLNYYFRGFLGKIIEDKEMVNFVKRCASYDVIRLINHYRPSLSIPEVAGAKLFNDAYISSATPPQKQVEKKRRSWFKSLICILLILKGFALFSNISKSSKADLDEPTPPTVELAPEYREGLAVMREHSILKRLGERIGMTTTLPLSEEYQERIRIYLEKQAKEGRIRAKHDLQFLMERGVISTESPYESRYADMSAEELSKAKELLSAVDPNLVAKEVKRAKKVEELLEQRLRQKAKEGDKDAERALKFFLINRVSRNMHENQDDE